MRGGHDWGKRGHGLLHGVLPGLRGLLRGVLRGVLKHCADEVQRVGGAAAVVALSTSSIRQQREGMHDHALKIVCLPVGCHWSSKELMQGSRGREMVRVTMRQNACMTRA